MTSFSRSLEGPVNTASRLTNLLPSLLLRLPTHFTRAYSNHIDEQGVGLAFARIRPLKHFDRVDKGKKIVLSSL